MNQKILTASLAALVLTTGAFSVQAESTPPNFYSLNEVVVTASRTPEKKIDANADVAVVSAKEIAAKHYSDVTEAIRSVPGVALGSQNASSQISFTNPLTINGSQNVVIMVDCMRINTNGVMSRTTALGTLTNMNSIDHIEILKGAASTLYGSDAQGGVINIITKKPEDGQVHTKLDLSRASYNGEKYGIYNEGSSNGFFWTVDAHKELQGTYKDGWDRHTINHLNAKSISTKFGYDFGNDSNLVFNYEKYKLDYTRPDGGTTSTQADHGKKDNDRISLQYNAKITDRVSNQFSIYRNQNRIEDNYNNLTNIADGSGYTDIHMKTTGISDQLTYKGNSQTIIGGFDWYKDEIPHYKYSGGHGYLAIDSPEEGSSVTTTAFYIQDKWDITDKWNVTPGIRITHSSQYGNNTSPSLSIGYKVSENTNYYMNYKKFFRAPSLMELYYVSKNAPNLDPEKGYTVEMGVNHKFNSTLTGTLNIYTQRADNLIGWDSAAFNYGNSGKIKNNGVNLSLQKEFNKHVSTTLGYTYINADSSSKNSVYANIPKHELNIGINYQNSKLTASLWGRGIMDRYTTKDTMKDYSSYWVWDIAANYQFTKEATLFARVNNIFDQFYTDVGTSYGPNADPTNYHFWYSAPGRNFEIGLQFQF